MWELSAKLVARFPISFLDHTKETIACYQCFWYDPPFECRLLLRFAKAYSANSIGFDSFKFLSKSSQTIHPSIGVFGIQVSFVVSTNLFTISTALQSFKWSVILSNIACCRPSLLHLAKILAAIVSMYASVVKDAVHFGSPGIPLLCSDQMFQTQRHWLQVYQAATCPRMLRPGEEHTSQWWGPKIVVLEKENMIKEINS